ncbi:hypothetical protein M378DRAFT_164855 [Amanita muscaria Koide BX008]|uniref:Uncharacterized protein n=1 Tax=Amanita muscaria (strain Koide BX008) TaxID=946122 RepID=A0A0C2WNI1_AMAMK|nr:hypothetical protein M378DRAFT_164855 [Amanita muscaria Koide BX008]
MALLGLLHTPMFNPAKRMRRTATAVMAGAFDVRPPRDVLTSLLNGVGPYKAVEKDEETRRNRRKEKKERDRERKRQKAEAKARQRELVGEVKSEVVSNVQIPSASAPPKAQTSTTSASSFWRARPAIHIATMQRSVSVTPPPPSTPPPLASTSTSTPAPTTSVGTSRTSSKRPFTPDEEEEKYTPTSSRPRKKRVAVRKGWKGWVEGSPPPSEKLINLDAMPVIQERRTRSGRVLGNGSPEKDNWV